MTQARTPRNVSKPGGALAIDIVDPQPLMRVGLAVALSHAPGFEPGEVRAHIGELPASSRPVVVGLSRGDAAEVGAVRELTNRGRVVLVLLPDRGWHAWATLRQHVAGGLSRVAPVSRVMVALRAIAAGQSYWWLDPADTDEDFPTVAGTLSERERELLGLLAVGCSDREIADQLVISVRTVWSHLERIRAKTGVRGRVELAMLAWHVEAGTLPERSGRPEHDDSAEPEPSSRPEPEAGTTMAYRQDGRRMLVSQRVAVTERVSRVSCGTGASVERHGSAA